MPYPHLVLVLVFQIEPSSIRLFSVYLVIKIDVMPQLYCENELSVEFHSFFIDFVALASERKVELGHLVVEILILWPRWKRRSFLFANGGRLHATRTKLALLLILLFVLSEDELGLVISLVQLYDRRGVFARYDIHSS